MPTLRVTILSALAVILCSVATHAQFSSPAFDPKCYFPDPKNPGQAVSYYGSDTDAHLGLGLLNIGPEPGDTTERLIFGGLGSDPSLLTQQAIRPPFTIDELNPRILRSMPVYPTNGKIDSYAIIATGHFHCKDRTDLLAFNGDFSYRIYWADEHGQYDSTRYSALRHKYWDSLNASLESQPYIAYLTSDTVEDLVFGGSMCFRRSNGNLDSCFYTATIFRGGAGLFRQQPVAVSDSMRLSASTSDNTDIMRWRTTEGDFRGVGRKDLIAFSWSGGYLYRNDPPFSLQKFELALRFDTLMSFADAPTFDRANVWKRATLAMKTRDALYDDFLLVYPTSDSSDGSIRIFHGGPDFGNQKKYLASPDVLMYHPGYYDPSLRFGGLRRITWLSDCGHLTGSKNPVLLAHSSNPYAAVHLWYVLGDALDDKVDMYESVPAGAANVEIIEANGDGRDDIILGMPYVTSPSGVREAGEMRVIYGTIRIPERKNAVSKHSASVTASLYPHPARQDITLSFAAPITGALKARLQNVLGATVFSDRTSVAGASSIRLHLPKLASGSYILTLSSDALPDQAFRLSIAR